MSLPTFPTSSQVMYSSGDVKPSPTETRTSVYRTLDAWRGVAALAVMLFHIIGPLPNHETFLQNPIYALLMEGGAGIWLFFVISGYCITHAATRSFQREEGVFQYAKARVRRIFPPCWFALALVLLASAAATYLTAHGHMHDGTLTNKKLFEQTPLFYFANLILMQIPLGQDYILDPCWTLCYEVGFYALVGVSLAVAKKRGREDLLFDGLHALTIVSMLVLIITPKSVSYPLDFWPVFGLGVLVYDFIRDSRRKMMRALFAVTLVEFVIFGTLYKGGIGHFGDGGRTSAAVGVLFSCLLLFLHRFDNAMMKTKVFQLLGWIGTFSYSLYLTHLLVVSGLERIILASRHLPHTPAFMLFACGLASIGVARVFFLVCERPFMNAKTRQKVVKEPEVERSAIPAG